MSNHDSRGLFIAIALIVVALLVIVGEWISVTVPRDQQHGIARELAIDQKD